MASLPHSAWAPLPHGAWRVGEIQTGGANLRRPTLLLFYLRTDNNSHSKPASNRWTPHQTALQRGLPTPTGLYGARHTPDTNHHLQLRFYIPPTNPTPQPTFTPQRPTPTATRTSHSDGADTKHLQPTPTATLTPPNKPTALHLQLLGAAW